MKWIIDNWSLLVVIACIIAYVIIAGKKSVINWLVYAVSMAEQEWGHGTGKIKLRSAYDMFVARYPLFSIIVPFAIFSKWVDDALVEMRKMLEDNLEIRAQITEDFDK